MHAHIIEIIRLRYKLNAIANELHKLFTATFKVGLYLYNNRSTEYVKTRFSINDRHDAAYPS